MMDRERDEVFEAFLRYEHEQVLSLAAESDLLEVEDINNTIAVDIPRHGQWNFSPKQYHAVRVPRSEYFSVRTECN